MARWQDIADDEPAFAAAVRQRLDAFTHKTLATLRKDGSPRISGIEATFASGDLWIGSMPGALKALDLQRDPRFALHSGSADPPDDPAGWAGDAKVAGVAVQVTDLETRAAVAAASGSPAAQPDDVPFFRLDIREAVLIRVGEPADHLLISVWKDGAGLREIRRA